ncbi:TetR/AcrR family transcriptional regulator [Ammonicoccus fulvus]|uniref:TetR/AcrR family transcriptional regulator n=1 Tax=Ammonicoccus fulvus TaxID=3138240 RepID=A0ABZ3FRR6_9ACTN
MAASLRDRKKAATMHRIQEIAVDMFEHRSFDAVRIEQIAEAAEVSPSTIYRYFGTKEGLVLQDEHDDVLRDSLADAFTEHNLWAVADQALALIEHDHFTRDAEMTLRRTKLWFDNPTLRAASFPVVDTWIDELTTMVLDSPHHDFEPDEARIVVASLIWGLVTAIESWYRGGADGSLGAYLRRMIAAVRKALGADLE